jgi:integrase/recombinase XerD
MTTSAIDHATETKLVRQYVETLPALRSSNENQRLRRACLTFRELHPGVSCLDVTHSTAWLPSWAASVPNTSVRMTQVEALGRWWSWLFEREVLNDNVLACFYPFARALREPVPVVLHHNLQRLIARYLDERHYYSSETHRAKLRRRLEHLNLFLHRQAPPWDGVAIKEEVLLEWFRHTCRGGSHYMGLVAGTVSGFLDYLGDLGRFPANPLAGLKMRYGRRLIGDILFSELGRGSTKLTSHAEKPPFRSRLATQLEGFVSIKRAMGLRYEATLRELQRFDRFVSEQPNPPDVVTAELVDAWLANGRDLSAATQKSRLGLVRQFSIYVARSRPETYVPDRTLLPRRVQTFRAYIYSPQEYRDLLRAALALPGPRATLRPKLFFTVLLLLYSTGMRVGEALRLRVRDLDLEGRTFFIRETKFLKSRIVPFSATLVEPLRDYLTDRLVAANKPEAFVFINHRSRPHSVDKFSESFRPLLVATGVPRTPCRHRPRVYDIRHTFAVTRVLQWYRQGVDVTAKLPLLATYMGHVDVLSTQTYLNSTAELLREGSERFERAFGEIIIESTEVSHEGR